MTAGFLNRSFLLAAFLLRASAHGDDGRSQHVALLISLDPRLNPHGIAALFHRHKHDPEKLERIFRKKFRNSQFQLDVVREANRYDLYQALHRPENVAIFWVSHEAPIAWAKEPGVVVDPLLLDRNGADVKDVFTNLPPNIRWISLVACYSSRIITRLGPTPARFQGFNHFAIATRALKKAIAVGQSFLDENSVNPLSESARPARLATVQVKRIMKAKSPSFYPAVTLQAGQEMIGAFPQETLPTGITLTQEEELSWNTGENPSPGDLELLVQSGFDPMRIPSGFDLGRFEVRNTQGDVWAPFADADGTPFGVTEEILDPLSPRP